MKIFFIESKGRGQKYGVGSYGSSLAFEFTNNCSFQFIHVHVNCTDHAHVTSTQVNGIDQLYVPPPELLPSGLSPDDLFLTSHAAKGLYAVLSADFDKSRKNILHLNSPIQSNLAFVAREYNDCQVVYTVHILLWRLIYGNDFQQFLREWEDPLHENNHPFLEWIVRERDLCLAADAIICMTDEAREFMIEYYGIENNRIHLIKNGINPASTELFTAEEKRNYKLRWGFGEDEKILLYAGRLDEGKGLEYLLKAMPDIVSKCSKVKLVIAGSGNYDYYFPYTTAIWPHLIFTGYRSKEELNIFYNIADVGILCSLHEQSSMVALEMMAHKLPVVATNIEGFKGVLENGVNCLKVNIIEDSGSIRLSEKEIANRVVDLINQPELASRLGENARSFMLGKLTSTSMARYVESIYKNVIEHIQMPSY
jgi:glycosyltransferase involved in cell wall biosynthesis